MNRVWTEEELEILRQDRAAKIPVPVTAAKLGRPVPATYARARLIGTLVQPHQSWDEASVALLRQLLSADPPMTDKRIAAELGRTVTQIRWKMQDLGLIGVRDLSKLAKVTASEMARPKAHRPVDQKPSRREEAPVRPAVAAKEVLPPLQEKQKPAAPVDPRASLDQALRKLETLLSERLKSSVAASESGMIQAAKDAIAEKGRIDQRLAKMGKDLATVEAQRRAEMRLKEQAEKAALEAARKAEDVARKAAGERARGEAKAQKAAPSQPAARKPALTAVQGVSQAASPRPAAQPAPPPAPKIVVTEAPAAAKPTIEPEAAPAQVSGRGGWKSVRKDPARITAQAKAKATNRADAVDLAQAAQAAIERFIAERGVTRTETSGIQTIVSRLQARGYIVVREGEGWVIDQRHRVDDEAALVAFAEARGIALDIAA
jgi:hypothetical protein